MPNSPDAPVQPVLGDRPARSMSAAISDAVSGLLHDFTGRGPMHTHTTIGPETIVVTLRNSLTKAERALAQTGQATAVLAMRRSVEAFFSDNLHEPDVAVEVFLMHDDDPPGGRSA